MPWLCSPATTSRHARCRRALYIELPLPFSLFAGYVAPLIDAAYWYFAADYAVFIIISFAAIYDESARAAFAAAFLMSFSLSPHAMELMFIDAAMLFAISRLLLFIRHAFAITPLLLHYASFALMLMPPGASPFIADYYAITPLLLMPLSFIFLCRHTLPLLRCWWCHYFHFLLPLIMPLLLPLIIDAIIICCHWLFICFDYFC